MRIPIITEDDYPGGNRMDNYDEEVEMENQEEPKESDESDAGRGEDEGAETWKHRCMCMKADFENYKRHAEAERDRLAELGKEAVLSELFPIAEHLERAVAEAEKKKGNQGILEGLRLVQKDLDRIFEKYDIERIPTVGECFDPEVHEAVGVMDVKGACEGTIVQEIKAGFKHGDKLIIPAKVVVAK